jgi:multidrug efflux pump
MGKEALIISACRQGIIYIPMILLMNAVFKMYGVIWAQTITDMLALLISVVLYMKTNRNLRMQESSKIG